MFRRMSPISGTLPPRREPLFDLVLNRLVNRRQRLLLVPPMLRPIPLVLRAQGYRVGPRSLPVIAVPACLLLSGLLGRSQRDGRPPHGTLAVARTSIKSPLRTSRISPVRVHSAGSISRRTPVAGCTPLAISSPFASASMNSLKAATAASHACCIGSETGGALDAAGRAAPRGKPPAHPGTTGSRRTLRGGSPRRRTAPYGRR